MRVDLRPIRSTTSRAFAEVDRLANPEGLVEDDRERGEEVREDALRCEADGNAANAEAGNQASDVDAEIVEHHDKRDEEEGSRDQHTDKIAGIGERLAAPFAFGTLIDISQDDGARPDCDLEDH